MPVSPLSQSFLARHQITQVTQPPITHIWHCDFWLFPKLKSPMKGKRFQTIDETQENMMEQLMAIPTKDFAELFEQWKRHWELCEVARCLLLKGTEASLSYVQCFLYLMSSSMSLFLTGMARHFLERPRHVLFRSRYTSYAARSLVLSLTHQPHHCPHRGSMVSQELKGSELDQCMLPSQ